MSLYHISIIVTQMTRISLVSLTHTARTSLENQCSNTGAARLDTADEAISLLWNEMSTLRKWVETKPSVLQERNTNVKSSGTEVVKLRREVKSLRSEVSDLKQLVNAMLLK